MPAYNAAKTVAQTVDEVHQQGIVDKMILVDDKSRDDTVAVASQLPGVSVHVHEQNRGYGGNQKTCYRLALEAGADIIIMLHPDYQYTPKLIPAMASIIANDLHPCVLGSRILGGYSLRGGMPYWKYVSNRFLTFAENILLGAKLSEYHTGYRAFSRATPGKGGCLAQFGRFCFRQPNARTNPVARFHDWRSELSHQIFSRSVLDQFPPQRKIWFRLSIGGIAISAGEDRTDAIEIVSSAGRRNVAKRQRKLAGHGMSGIMVRGSFALKEQRMCAGYFHRPFRTG